MKPLNEMIADQNEAAFVQLFKDLKRILYAKTWNEKRILYEYARIEATINMYCVNELIRGNLQDKSNK